VNSGAAFRPLTNGAKTKDRKIIPPIQVTAARMCRTTRVEYMRPQSLKRVIVVTLNAEGR
jgi:hypothetical protein